MIKVCIKCGIEKDVSNFFFRKDTQKYNNQCKVCIKNYTQKYYNDNKENLKNYDIKRNKTKERKEYRQKYTQKYYNDNKENLKNYRDKYYINNKEDILKKSKEYNSKPEIKRKKQQYNEQYFSKPETKQKRQQYNEHYCSKPENKKRQNQNRKYKRQINLSFRLNDTISSSVRRSLHSNKQGNHWETLVGYTQKQLKQHLEQQFEPWMSWYNYGNKKGCWSIDHKIPVSLYNIADYNCDDFNKCWALSNLRPLNQSYNIIKCNEIDWHLIWQDNIEDLLPDKILNILKD